MRKKKDRNSCGILSCFSRSGFRKKGQVSWQLVAAVVAVLILIVVLFVVLVVLKGGGGKILDSIKNVFRFGR